MLPVYVEQKINLLIQNIHLTSNHQLKKGDRIELFSSFGEAQTIINKGSDEVSILWDDETENKNVTHSFATQVIIWLGIITTYKVLPVWEHLDVLENEPDKTNLEFPKKMLKEAENVLLNRTTIQSLETKYKSDFYLLPIALRKRTPQNVFSVVRSSYSTLGILLYGLEPNLAIDDFARFSCDAYAGIDDNKWGFWSDFNIEHLYGTISNHITDEDIDFFEKIQTINPLLLTENLQINSPIVEDWTQEQKEYIKTYKPFRYSKEKTLEFWTWWLLEAIPQAWELAQQFYIPQ